MSAAAAEPSGAAAAHGMQSVLFFVHAVALTMMLSDIAIFWGLLQKGVLGQLVQSNAVFNLDDLLLFFLVFMALCVAASGGYMACVRYRLGGVFGVAARLNCLLAAIMALVVVHFEVVSVALQAQYIGFALLWALSLYSLRHGFGPEDDRSFSALLQAARRYTLGLFVRKT